MPGISHITGNQCYEVEQNYKMQDIYGKSVGNIYIMYLEISYFFMNRNDHLPLRGKFSLFRITLFFLL